MANEIKYFLDSLKKEALLADSLAYQFKDGKWQSIDGAPVASEVLQGLKNVPALKRYTRLTMPSRAIFLLKGGKLAVVKPVIARTKDNTLSRILSLLDDASQSATSEFHARHDELTGILNRHGIKSELSKQFSSLSKPDESHDSGKQVSGPILLTIIAFDIDRFKSVNDTYGHAAGDYVLAIFAQKIQEFVNQLPTIYSGSFIFGRPGGEEFELIILGNISHSERKKIGDSLVEIIRRPLSAEINNALKKPKTDVPEVVTASLGISARRIAANDNVENLHSTLRTEADAALYRAKADGRNRIREYDEIRNRHGKVIEHNEPSDLVQLDIGSNVGVLRGDTYGVYYPPYNGEESMFESGSSTKIRGKYPAISSSIVRVVNVEKEISTAVITTRQTNEQIPVGSSLRFIHMGSLPGKFFEWIHEYPTTGNLYELKNNLVSGIENDSLEAVFILRTSVPKSEVRIKDIIRAEFLSLCSLFFPPNSHAFYTITGDFYVTVKRHPEIQTDFEELCDRLKKQWDSTQYTVSAGVCVIDALPQYAPRTPEAIVFYCTSTLRAQEKNGIFSFFDAHTPNDALFEWKQIGRVDDAIIDFQNFRKLGFSSPALFNQLGLAIYENDLSEQYALAEATLSRAIEVDDSEPVYKANLAILLTKLGKYDRALELFKIVEIFIMDERDGYLMSYAKVALEAYNSEKNSDRDFVANLLLQVLSENSNRRLSAFYAGIVNEIKIAMGSGRFD